MITHTWMFIACILHAKYSHSNISSHISECFDSIPRSGQPKWERTSRTTEGVVTSVIVYGACLVVIVLVCVTDRNMPRSSRYSSKRSFANPWKENGKILNIWEKEYHFYS